MAPGPAHHRPLGDVGDWPQYEPLIIAHDVGHTHDRSTAVVGGLSPYGPRVVGIGDVEELQQGLFASARARALAEVDHRQKRNGLIVADVGFDPTYAELLFETFGPRVVGLRITGAGDGMNCVRWPVSGGHVLVYHVARSYLLELLHRELEMNQVRFAAGPATRKAFEQLANLELEYRPSGTVYRCPVGLHDDLGMSVAMLVWAARHPHLPTWTRQLLRPYRRPTPRSSSGWGAFT